MGDISFVIDGIKATAFEGDTILEAAQKAGIYIPHICSHPDLPGVENLRPADTVYRGGVSLKNLKPGLEYEGCQLCKVEIDGQSGLQRACITPVTEGIVIRTNTAAVSEFRSDRLMFIIAKHPHACLMCAQKVGCARFPCSTNVPENERCCPQFGNCELQQVAEYIGIKSETPRYLYMDRPVIKNEPLFEKDYNLCIGCTRCIRVCREVRGVKALDFVFDEEGRVIVGTVSPTLVESACRFCTACVAICPTGALRDKEEFKEVPCRTACPAGINIPRYIRLINERKFGEAAVVIREKVPLPGVLGHICTHNCELKCRRRKLNEPVAIRALKKFAVEQDDQGWKQKPVPVESTDKKIAIVGSGPAGLSAAYYLRHLGHTITIFESASQPGGMMRWAIPRFLLPQEVLDEEIAGILSCGIELKLDSLVENAGELLKQGYDAALLAIGLQVGNKLPILGNDLEGVVIGLDFLREVNEGREIKLGEKVLVVGGGGVACDVARTVRRLGVSRVAMAFLESRETMPAPSNDARQTEDEGIGIYPSRSFKQVLGENGHVTGVECLLIKSMKFDKEGRLQVETIPGSEHIIEADTIIFAVGQAVDSRFIRQSGLDVTGRRLIRANPDLETNLKGVFVSGDVLSGPASVVEAIATGKQAAMSIDRFLGGKGLIEGELSEETLLSSYLGREEGFAARTRIEPGLCLVRDRVSSFKAVELTLTKEQAQAEAARCLKCDLRFGISKPVLPPRKGLWLAFVPENVSRVPPVEGIFQLLDENENIICIKGALDLKSELQTQLEHCEKVRFFTYEEEPMYTKKETELLQQYTFKHGGMPEMNRELDDLF